MLKIDKNILLMSLVEIPKPLYNGNSLNVIDTIFFDSDDEHLTQISKKVNEATFERISAEFAFRQLVIYRSLLKPTLTEFTSTSLGLDDACMTGKIIAMGVPIPSIHNAYTIKSYRRRPGHWGWQINDYGRICGVSSSL